MSILKSSLGLLLTILVWSAPAASQAASATASSAQEAYCRAKYRCSTNPYSHDYQGTICRMQLKQCLQWRSSAPSARR